MSNNVAVSKLIEYLRIKSVHPEPDYGNYYEHLWSKLTLINCEW